MLPYDKRLKANSRALRSNMTDAEQKLWRRLRRKQINGWQFYRQKPLGPYIADFYCPVVSLVVEVDVGQHFKPEHLAADQQRDAYLAGLGLRVLRFDNRQVLLEMEAVLEVIGRIPPGPPFSKGGVGSPLVDGNDADLSATAAQFSKREVGSPPVDEEPAASGQTTSEQTAFVERHGAPVPSFETGERGGEGLSVPAQLQPVPPFKKGGLPTPERQTDRTKKLQSVPPFEKGGLGGINTHPSSENGEGS